MKKLILLTISFFPVLVFFSCSKDNGDGTVPLSSIMVSSAEVSLKIGDVKAIIYTLSPSNTTDSIITWSSSDPSIIQIEGENMKALKSGTCQITGKSKQGVQKTFTASASNIEIEKVTLSHLTNIVTVGETIQLSIMISPANATDKTLSFESSNHKVVEAGDYSFLAVGVGTATITAKDKSGTVKGSITMTVKPILVSDILLSTKSITMELGKTMTVTATVSPNNATNKSIKWMSDDNSIATVDQNGVLIAKGLGVAKITVISEDGNASISFSVFVAGVDYFIKSNMSGIVTSYNSSTGLYTGTMSSYLRNESSKTILPISFEILDALSNKSLLKLTTFNPLLPGEEINTAHYNLSNVYKPYIVWKYLYDGNIYTIEKRIYY